MEKEGLTKWEGVVTTEYRLGKDDLIVCKGGLAPSPWTMILSYTMLRVKKAKNSDEDDVFLTGGLDIGYPMNPDCQCSL